jgi:hypothetical protein
VISGPGRSSNAVDATKRGMLFGTPLGVDMPIDAHSLKRL